MVHPHGALFMGVADPCAAAPSINSVSATASMRACASGGGVHHHGSVSLSASLPVGFKIEWQYKHDSGSFVTPTTQYTTSTTNDEYQHAGTTDVDQGGFSYAITSCTCTWRCRIVLSDGTPCGDGSWTTSSTSNNGIGNDGDLWDCP